MGKGFVCLNIKFKFVEHRKLITELHNRRKAELNKYG